MAYILLAQSFGLSKANLPVNIVETSTGVPAVLLSSATSGLISANGDTFLDSNGDLAVYVDNSKSYTVSVDSGTQATILGNLTPTQIAAGAVGIAGVRADGGLINLSGVLSALSPTQITNVTTLMGDAYFMPAPTGVLATDHAALVSALAAPQKVVLFGYAGTYLTNAQIAWPSRKKLVSLCLEGEVSIKADNSSTNSWMFTLGGTAKDNFGAENITFDMNGTARFAATGTDTCGFMDGAIVSTHTNGTWRKCTFKDSRINAMFNISGFDHVWKECMFSVSRRVMLSLRGLTRAEISGCTFYDYSTEGTSGPPIQLLQFGSTPSTGIRILGNKFRALTSAGFAVGIVADSGPFNQFVFVGNDLDANGGLGNGVSGSCDRSVVAGNSFRNGRADPPTHRNGIEMAGSHNIVTGNSFENGCITIPAAIGQFPTGNVVTNNTMLFTISTGTSLILSSYFGQQNLVVANNTVTVYASGSATVNCAFYVGVNGSGPLRSCIFENNTGRIIGTATGSFIRVLSGVGTGAFGTGTDYASYVAIKNNTGVNFTNGISLPNTANDTFLTIVDNDFRRCTNLSTGTATGVGNVIDVAPIHNGPWPQSLAFSTPLAVDFNQGRDVTVGALTGNITLSSPTNVPTGSGMAKVSYSFTQDATGGRTLTWSALHKGAWPTAAGTANQKKTVTGFSDGTNLIFTSDSGWY